MQEYHIDPRLDQTTKVNIKRPREVAYFSYNDKHELKTFSTESLRYYYPAFWQVASGPPPKPVDMNVGFGKLIHFDGSAKDEHLDSLLDTIQEMERKEGGRTHVDFITWRGMMTKFVTAPFDKDAWEMYATKYQGTIFIEESHSFKAKRQPPGRELDIGYKFETLNMLDRPMQECTREEIESRGDNVVDTTAQYCSVVETAIGGHSMLIGGEVDGVIGYKPESPLDPPRWVELKTTREPLDERGNRIFTDKLLKYWAQSFLIGCPTVIVGWRTPQGFLYKYTELETQRIPAIAGQNGNCDWNANICLASAKDILGFLKETLFDETVHRIWKPAKTKKILIEPMGQGTGDIIKPSFKDWRSLLA